MACKTNLKIAKRMVASGFLNAEQINKLTAKTKLQRGADALYEVYVNSILSGPITHAVNMGSNALLTTWSPTQQFLESASAASRGDWKKASVDMAKSKAMINGLVEGVGDIFRLYNKHTSGDITKLGYDPSIKISADKIKNRHAPAIVSMDDGFLGPVINRLGAFVRMPGNALLEEDKWFKMIHYRMQTSSLAMEKAMQQSTDLATRKNLYNFYRYNPDIATVKTAKNQGEYFTFTNSLGTHGLKAASALRGVPSLRYIFPFINTPTNIVKMGLNHGLYGNLTKDLKVALMSSDVVAKDAARAKIAMGTAAPLAIMAMMDEDRITGRIDMATTNGRFKASQKMPQYSLRVGDEWYSYERIEPLRSILGLYATMIDAYKHIEPYDKDGQPNPLMDQITFTGIAPIIQTMGDNYMLNEIGGVLDLLTATSVGNPDEFFDVFKRTAANMVVPSALRQVNKVYFDDAYRQADTFLQKLSQGIPGLSQSLPPRRTLWGDEQHYSQGVPFGILAAVSSTGVKNDFIDNAMIELEVNIPNVPKYVYFEAGKGQPPVKVELTPEQRDVYALIRGKGRGPDREPTLKQKIAEVMGHRDFGPASKMDRVIVLENAITKYNQLANGTVKKIPEVEALFRKNLQLREDNRKRSQNQ